MAKDSSEEPFGSTLEHDTHVSIGKSLAQNPGDPGVLAVDPNRQWALAKRLRTHGEGFGVFVVGVRPLVMLRVAFAPELRSLRLALHGDTLRARGLDHLRSVVSFRPHGEHRTGRVT